MSTYQLIFTVVALYTFFELWFVLPAGAVVFKARWRGFGARSAADVGFRVGKASRVIFSALLPSSRVFVAEPWPFTLTDDALEARSSYGLPPEPEAVTTWAMPRAPVKPEIERHTVLLGKGRRLRFSSPAAAAAAADPLLRELLSGDRSLDDAVAARFDDGAAKERFASYGAALGLRAVTTVLALFVFVGLPLVWTLDIRIPLVNQVGSYFLLLLAVMMATWSVHRALFAERVAERWSWLLAMVVSPAEAITVGHKLERALFAKFHPLTVAAVLCPRDELRRLGERTLRGLDHAPPSTSRDVVRVAAEALLRRHAIDPAQLRVAPAAEPGCRGYCPRCLDQFTRDDGDCPACLGIGLRALAS